MCLYQVNSPLIIYTLLATDFRLVSSPLGVLCYPLPRKKSYTASLGNGFSRLLDNAKLVGMIEI